MIVSRKSAYYSILNYDPDFPSFKWVNFKNQSNRLSGPSYRVFKVYTINANFHNLYNVARKDSNWRINDKFLRLFKEI